MDSIMEDIFSVKKSSDFDKLKKKLDKNIDNLKKNPQLCTKALSLLNPSKHTMGCIYFLFAKSLNQQIDNIFFQKTEEVLTKMNIMQARKCSKIFSTVIHKYCETCLVNDLNGRGICILEKGISNFCKNETYLSPMHPDLLCLCLKLKNFKLGIKFIESHPIYEIEPDMTGVGPRDFLLYFYYSGMIYLGVKDFEKAYTFFETCLTIPAFGLNAIMVEAFKKYVLCSLLSSGKFTKITKHASIIVKKYMKHICSSYLDFSREFSKRKTKKVEELAKEYKKEFEKDDNYGLVKQCLKALYRKQIKALTAMYMTLSLKDIAKKSNLKESEAEKVILEMIQNNEIKAKINQEKGMVLFIDEELTSHSSVNTTQLLKESIKNTSEIANKIKTMNDDLSSSTSYIAKLNGVKDYDDIESEQMPGMMGMMHRFGQFSGGFNGF